MTGAYSCLFPISGRGVHTLQSGSRRAIEVFKKQLAREPGNLAARWLLNIAYMTVGEYPEKVPPRWLFPPELFRSEYDIKRFPDVSMAAGLEMVRLAGGSIMEDFDGDGYQDIMASSWGLRDQLRFFRNDGDGRFVERSVACHASPLRSAGRRAANASDIGDAAFPRDIPVPVLSLGCHLRSAGRRANSFSSSG